MSFIHSSSHVRRIGLISTTTTIAAIGKQMRKCSSESKFSSFTGLALLFWKVYNRRTQGRRPNQLPNRPPLTRQASNDG
jgi:hypothetical protein